MTEMLKQQIAQFIALTTIIIIFHLGQSLNQDIQFTIQIIHTGSQIFLNLQTLLAIFWIPIMNSVVSLFQLGLAFLFLIVLLYDLVTYFLVNTIHEQNGADAQNDFQQSDVSKQLNKSIICIHRKHLLT